MNLSEVKNQIPDFGRDIRLNLETVLTEEGAAGLTAAQIHSIALACAYSLTSPEIIEALLLEFKPDDLTVHAAKAAATIMAMNNVYYRSMHLLGDGELAKLPARLRMTVIGKPGVAKLDFELMCFAVSALAGCGQCLTSHLQELRKGGLGDEGVQSALRIASVLNATNTALKLAHM